VVTKWQHGKDAQALRIILFGLQSILKFGFNADLKFDI
jgi:hypothetical protein